MKRMLGLLCLLAGPAGAECRQALAIGLDVSGSVDAAEEALQVGGMAGALTAPAVLEALLQVPEAPVRIMIYEWSGPTSQRVLVPWTDADSVAAVQAMARRLMGEPRYPSASETALGAAMQAGAAMLETQGDCWRLTLDVTGDGRSNLGLRPDQAVMRAAGRDVTVNALLIGLPEGRGGDPGVAELSSYFRAYVIRGPDAFVEIAIGYEDFEQAMTRKLLKELEDLQVGDAAVGRALRIAGARAP